MADLTAESARSIIGSYQRTQASDAGSAGMAPVEEFAIEASLLGLTEDDFDWMSWPPYESRQFIDPAFIASADAETLRRIATAHFRLDRFAEGHLREMQAEGVIPQIVERLQQLLDAGELE